MNEENKDIRIFKYNMSFYYQSTIIYFIVFILYMVIRGEFVEDSFVLITKDPIIYLLGMIVIISLISLLQNLYKNKYMEIQRQFNFICKQKQKKNFYFRSNEIHKIVQRQKKNEKQSIKGHQNKINKKKKTDYNKAL